MPSCYVRKRSIVPCAAGRIARTILAITALGERLTTVWGGGVDAAAHQQTSRNRFLTRPNVRSRRYSFGLAFSSAMNRAIRSSSTGSGTEPIARMAS